MSAALQYLSVMCVGFLPLSLTMVYYTTIRSYGETVAPMVASFISVGVNLVGNYVLIFGKFGAPKLGVVGAAMATVIARFVEFAYIVCIYCGVGAHTCCKGAVRGRRAAEYVCAGRAYGQLHQERRAAPSQ